MRGMSRKILKTCRECREFYYSEDVREHENTSPNYKAITQAVSVIVSLNIRELLGIKPEQIENGIEKLKALRATLVPEAGVFSKDFVTRNINIMLKCLRAGVIPDANIWIGSDEAAEDALRRLADEIKL